MSAENIGPEMGTVMNPEISDLRDHCGVWAIWDPTNPDIRQDALIGANYIQHRGEGGAGIAVIAPGVSGMPYIRGSGKVREVFGVHGEALQELPADATAAVVHTRWPTDGAPGDWDQPRFGSINATTHNGQLTNKHELALRYGVSAEGTDTDVFCNSVDKVALELGGDVERAVLQILPHVRGSFCFAILTKDKLIAARDRNGIRPFQLGRTATGGYIITSENMAITHVPGATYEREIEPAEMVVIDKNGFRSGKWAQPDPAACMLEYVYLANKETMLNGIKVGDARQGFGRAAARRLAPQVLARIAALIPLPNGANQATHGMEAATGIPTVPLLKLNPALEYARSFIQPTQEAQFTAADGKLVVDPAEIPRVEGMPVAVVDDSMVRSNMMRANLPKVLSAHPSEVHVVIAAPQYVGTCDLGVDTPSTEDLIAVQMGNDTAAIAAEIGADSVTYTELEDMFRVVGEKVCTSCLGGSKPARIVDGDERPKFGRHGTELGTLAVSA